MSKINLDLPKDMLEQINTINGVLERNNLDPFVEHRDVFHDAGFRYVSEEISLKKAMAELRVASRISMEEDAEAATLVASLKETKKRLIKSGVPRNEKATVDNTVSNNDILSYLRSIVDLYYDVMSGNGNGEAEEIEHVLLIMLTHYTTTYGYACGLQEGDLIMDDRNNIIGTLGKRVSVVELVTMCAGLVAMSICVANTVIGAGNMERYVNTLLLHSEAWEDKDF